MNNRGIRVIVFMFLVLLSNNISGQVVDDDNLSNLVSFDGEPSLAVNPTNTDNIIAGWMRLRLDGKVWIATSASFDGGKSWSAINFLPHDTVVNGSADVCIIFHRSGIAYLSYVNFRISPDSAGAVFLAKSTDGGKSWNKPNKIIDMKDKPDIPLDRPWIAVDNSGGENDGRVYASTMSYYEYKGGQHHVYLRSTNDGGNSWSEIIQVDNKEFSPGLLNISYAPLSVGADGKVYLGYMSYDLAASLYVRLYIAVSSDMGQNFQRYVVANVYPEYFKLPAYSISANPVIAGNVVFSWCDTRYGDLDILSSRSTDGGQSWSAPIRVNDDTKGNKIVQDQLWSIYSPKGSLALVWRDRRNYDTTKTSSFDIYASISTDGGKSFQPNMRLSSTSSGSPTVGCCNSFIGIGLTDSIITTDWGGFHNNDWDVFMNRRNFTKITSTEELKISDKFELQIFSNPGSTEFEVQFMFPSEQSAELILMNSNAAKVKTLMSKRFERGSYNARFNTNGMSSGVYYVVLRNSSSVLSRKMIILN